MYLNTKKILNKKGNLFIILHVTFNLSHLPAAMCSWLLLIYSSWNIIVCDLIRNGRTSWCQEGDADGARSCVKTPRTYSK